MTSDSIPRTGSARSSLAWTPDQAPDQAGKRVVITGSNTGIGFATAELLARKNAQIVLACRNPDKGREALARLQRTVPGVEAAFVRLDLSSLASVREAAAELVAQERPIDILINNAGVMMTPQGRTADGFETQFGTNVLGHFALTGLLLPLLESSRNARVVWLGSVAHWSGEIDFDNLNAERGYGRWSAYAQSKLADVMLAYEMERWCRRRGSRISALSAHPGGTRSELARNSTLLQVINFLTSSIIQETKDGALPSVRAAIDPAAAGGEYYGPGGLTTMSGPPTRQRSSTRSHDEDVARRLWERCEALTGVRWT
jgi:NAD(P)-dependent dehydrogenase (short-subunit alcohol dehydrogenase family)